MMTHIDEIMSNTMINDGGPAFPILPVGTGDPRDGMSPGHNGLSKREWFAGMALVGMLSSGNAHLLERHQDGLEEAAFLYADAMIAAGEAQQ